MSEDVMPGARQGKKISNGKTRRDSVRPPVVPICWLSLWIWCQIAFDITMRGTGKTGEAIGVGLLTSLGLAADYTSFRLFMEEYQHPAYWRTKGNRYAAENDLDNIISGNYSGRDFCQQTYGSLDLVAWGRFSEMYRNGAYKGSALYTFMVVYVMPILMCYALYRGINKKSAVVGWRRYR